MNIQDEIKKAAVMHALEVYLRAKEFMEWIRGGIELPWPKPIKEGIVAINPNLVGENIKSYDLVEHQDTVIVLAPKKLNKAEKELILKILG